MTSRNHPALSAQRRVRPCSKNRAMWMRSGMRGWFSGMRRCVPAFGAWALLLVAGWLSSAAAWGQVTFVGAPSTLLRGFDMPANLAIDEVGNIYISDTGLGVVYKETPLGGGEYSQTTVASGLSQPGGIAVDGAGNVYIAAVTTILIETPGANGYTQSHMGTFQNLRGITVAPSGNVYVVDISQATGGTVWEVTQEVDGSEQRTMVEHLNGPDGIAVDGNGIIFLTLPNAGQVGRYKIDGDGVHTSSLGSGFQFPTGIRLDGSGNVFVIDNQANLLYEEQPVNGGNPYSQTVVESGGLARPNDVALDAYGNLFVADIGNSRIVRVARSGVEFGAVDVGWTSPIVPMTFQIAGGTSVASIVFLISGAGQKDIEEAGATNCVLGTYQSTATCTIPVRFTPLTPGMSMGAVVFRDATGNALGTVPVAGIGEGPLAVFEPGTVSTWTVGTGQPFGLRVDGAGNIFIADWVGHQVLRVSPTGVKTTVGSGFTTPLDVALDGAGNLYVADAMLPYIVEVTRNGKRLVLGGGANLVAPRAITLDEHGNIFVGDGGKGRVVEILASGASAVIADNLGTVTALTVDGAGNVYCATGGKIIEINQQGAQTTVLSQLGSVLGLAFDAAGNLYFVDQNGGRVVELTPDGRQTVLVEDSEISAVTVDRYGNVFYTANQAKLTEIMRATPPALSFAATPEGGNSGFEPQTVTVRNVGNQPLDFLDVAFPTDFPESVMGYGTDCASFSEIAANATCTLSVEFAPVALMTSTTPKVLSEHLTLSTNQVSVLPGANGLTVQSWSGPLPVSGTETGPLSVLTLSADHANSILGQTITLTATVSGGGPVPTGGVIFSLRGLTLGTASVSSGVAKLSTAILPVGPDTVLASYLGDSVYGAAAGTGTVQVSPATPAIGLTLSKSASALGAAVNMTAVMIDPVLGIAVTGEVSFYADGNLLGQASVGVTGNAVLTTSAVPGGTHNITATFGGAPDYSAVTSSKIPLTVSKAQPTLSLTASSSSVSAGEAVTFTAVFGGQVTGFAPTGLVTFQDGGTSIGFSAFVNGGKAVSVPMVLSAGTNNITASYSADADYAGATSNVVKVVVNSGLRPSGSHE